MAHPVTVTFAGPIDRPRGRRADHRVSLRPPRPSGTFTWLNDRVLQWNPDGFWPAHSTITVTAGGAKTSFETGCRGGGCRRHRAHTFTVSIDGQVAREMPASMGKPRFPTPVGSFSVLRKEAVVVMDSRTIGIPLDDPEGYKLTVYNAVRDHLRRRLRALGSMVDGITGLCERQPRLHQPQSRQRGMVFRHGQCR